MELSSRRRKIVDITSHSLEDFFFSFFSGGGKTRVCQVVDITAIHVVSRPFIHVRSVRRKGCITPTNPSPHGGRGALPSEGGSPSDLLFLAGGGFSCFFFSSSSY